MSDDVLLEFENYPVDGVESTSRAVVFGPESSGFAVLIELDPSGGPLRVTVGNGPPHEDAPRLIPEVLHDVADAIAHLEDNVDYWAAVRQALIE